MVSHTTGVTVSYLTGVMASSCPLPSLPPPLSPSPPLSPLPFLPHNNHEVTDIGSLLFSPLPHNHHEVIRTDSCKNVLKFCNPNFTMKHAINNSCFSPLHQ